MLSRIWLSFLEFFKHVFELLWRCFRSPFGWLLANLSLLWEYSKSAFVKAIVWLFDWFVEAQSHVIDYVCQFITELSRDFPQVDYDTVYATVYKVRAVLSFFDNLLPISEAILGVELILMTMVFLFAVKITIRFMESVVLKGLFMVFV